MLLPGMFDSLQITKTEARIISSAYFCAYTVWSSLLGVLSDRFNVLLLLTPFPDLAGIDRGIALAVAIMGSGVGIVSGAHGRR